MKASVVFGAGWEDDLLEVLWQDPGRVFCRLWRDDAEGDTHAFIPLVGAEHPTPPRLELFPTQLNWWVVGDSHRAESLRVCGLQHHCHGGKDAGPVIAGLEGSLDGGRSRRQFGPRGGRAVRGEREHRDPLGAAVACRG